MNFYNVANTNNELTANLGEARDKVGIAVLDGHQMEFVVSEIDENFWLEVWCG